MTVKTRLSSLRSRKSLSQAGRLPLCQKSFTLPSDGSVCRKDCSRVTALSTVSSVTDATESGNDGGATVSIVSASVESSETALFRLSEKVAVPAIQELPQKINAKQNTYRFMFTPFITPHELNQFSLKSSVDELAEMFIRGIKNAPGKSDKTIDP